MTEQTPVRRRLWSRSRIVVAVLVGGLFAAVGTVAVARAAMSDQPYSVEGKVMCLNHLGSVGIWVNVDDGPGFWAGLHDVDVADGWAWTRFSARIPNGGNYSLNVGCGGNPQNWAMTAHSESLHATSVDLICNDIPPWLEFLGKKVFDEIFNPIVVKAFDMDIPYGHCEAVRQVGQLAPKPSLTTVPPIQQQPPKPLPTRSSTTTAPKPPTTPSQTAPTTTHSEPPPQTWPGTIYNNSKFAVRVRSGPGTSYSIVAEYAAGGGQAVTVICVVSGEAWTDPTGNPSGNTWYQVSNGYIATGYVNVGNASARAC
jgi:hypothetical protein